MSDIIPQKRCTGICQRLLPATPEYFHRNGKGLRPDCKECRGKKVKTYYEQPGIHEQRIAYSQDYRQKNAEQVKTRKQEYYSRPEAQEQKRNYSRVYRSLPGKRDRKHELSKAWLALPEPREKHRAYDRTFQHRRRVRQKTSGNYTVQQIQNLLRLQKYKCYYCSVKFELKGNKHIYHIDHVVPLARGGSNDISNIVLACPKCNQHKQARLPHEWPDGGRLL